MITLLDRFLKGETSAAEEQQLLEWFRQPTTEAGLLAHYQRRWEEANTTISPEMANRMFLQLTAEIEQKSTPNSISIQKSKQPLWQWVVKIAVAAIVVLCASIGSYYYGQQTQESLVARGEMMETFVPYGTRKQIVLPDGSTVWLNAGSVLLHPKTFKGNTRAIYLSGEGNFEVAVDKKKPFIVRTKHLDVEALGTSFGVEAYPGSEITSATLEEGAVRINFNTRHHSPTLLKPNQRIVYHHKRQEIERSNVNAALYASWVNGYMVFKDETFDRIVSHIERQYNVRINYKTQPFKDKRYYLRFAPDETIDQVMGVFSIAADHFSYTIKNSEITIKE